MYRTSLNLSLFLLCHERLTYIVQEIHLSKDLRILYRRSIYPFPITLNVLVMKSNEVIRDLNKGGQKYLKYIFSP